MPLNNGVLTQIYLQSSHVRLIVDLFQESRIQGFKNSPEL